MKVQRFLPALPCGSSLRISTFLETNTLVVGGTIWPTASAMSFHLLQHRAALQRTTAVLELGSGTGALGLFAAGLGARCTLTEHKPPRSAIEPVSYNSEGDLELPAGHSDTLMELLRGNVSHNEHLCAHRPEVMELNWTDKQQLDLVKSTSPDGRGFSTIIGSDLTYNTALLKPLVETVAQLLSEGGTALIGHQPRLYNLTGKDSQLDEFRLASESAGLSLEVSDLPLLEQELNPRSLAQGKLLQLSHTGVS